MSATALTITLCTCRLKRTTDVMFGGKQVLICGYGEVRAGKGEVGKGYQGRDRL